MCQGGAGSEGGRGAVKCLLRGLVGCQEHLATIFSFCNLRRKDVTTSCCLPMNRQTSNTHCSGKVSSQAH